MSRIAGLLTLALLVLLGACRKDMKPDLPPATAVRTDTVEAVRKFYVPIDSALTSPFSIPSGPLAECPAVARARSAVIEQANQRLQRIHEVQGTEIKP